MHGTKPEQTIERQPDEELTRLSIQTPVPAADQKTAPQQQQQPEPATPQPSYKPEAARRFEAILRQELEGSSFSSEVEHETRIEAKLAARRELQSGTQKGGRSTALKPLTKSKALSSPFEGETILDKIISLIAHIIKSLERKFMRSFKRIFVPKRAQKKMQRLQELKKKEVQTKEKPEKSKSAAPGGRSGAAMG